MTSKVDQRSDIGETSVGKVDVSQLKNFIGGEWVEPKTDQYGDVVNPANGKKLVDVPLSGTDDVNEAVAAAKKHRKNGHSSQRQCVQKFYMISVK